MSATETAGPLVQGVLVESKADTIILALPGSDYRLHLAVASQLSAPLNKPIEGVIHARAKRVDVVPSGGRFIEPVYGRPRRVQGRISAIDTDHNTITVKAAAPFVCEFTVDQRATDFTVGQMVSFDIEKGARFEPTRGLHAGPNIDTNTADITPAGHKPTEGGGKLAVAPGKTQDAGALTADRGVEGRLPKSGEQPLTDHRK